jgi:hypothetical protein
MIRARDPSRPRPTSREAAEGRPRSPGSADALLAAALALPGLLALPWLPACSKSQPSQRVLSVTPPPAAPAARPAGGEADPYGEAAWTRQEAAVTRQLGAGFTLVRAHPFLVAGDEAPDRVRRHAQQTVRWAVRLLKKDYFKKDPPRILTIYLFKDAQSYQRHTRRLFGHPPSTPFGYYSESDGALVMNIATGGGTLIHEMVHPFMSANFPQAPAWFNEGVGSLYEQCGERDGRIVGFTNWRLAGLQRAIRAGKLPSFRTLVHTTTKQFYEQDPGTHYAQARYLMLYLQQKGLLRALYRRFRKAARASRPDDRDVTGWRSLLATLGISATQMADFQRRWEAWVLGLTFP